MIDAEEGGVLDDVHAFLMAVVRVRAPMDIGQQAGGMAKPAFFLSFLIEQRLHEAVGPITELLGMAWRAEKSRLNCAAATKQRILFSLRRVEHFVEKTFRTRSPKT